MTGNANVEPIECNDISFFVDGCPESISVTDHAFLSYIKLSAFVNTAYISVFCSLNGSPLLEKSWSQVKKVVDKVQKDVCGHANYTYY